MREKVLVNDWPEEETPGAGQIKTRTLFTGITNGTERNQLIRGNYAPADEHLPAPFDYQSVGEVTEVGAGVSEFSIGDVVFTDRIPVEFPVSTVSGNVVGLHDTIDLSQAALFGMARSPGDHLRYRCTQARAGEADRRRRASYRYRW